MPTSTASAEDIAVLRGRVKVALTDPKHLVDQRDVDRLMTDDDYAALFVRWRPTNEERNSLVLKCFKSRKKSKVNDVRNKDVDETLKKGLIFLRGRALDGTRVLYMRCGKMNRKDKESNMKLFTFWLERIQRTEPGKPVTFVMDTTGARLSEGDMEFNNFIIEGFMSTFPCFVQRLIIYNLPWILNSIWILISKMLSAEQRQKTVLCSNKGILNYIDADNALEHMYGKDKFEYSYPPFPDDLTKFTSEDLLQRRKTKRNENF